MSAPNALNIALCLGVFVLLILVSGCAAVPETLPPVCSAFPDPSGVPFHEQAWLEPVEIWVAETLAWYVASGCA